MGRVAPEGSFQRKMGGNCAARGGVVDADVEEVDAVFGQRRNEAARVAGNIGHFGAGGHHAEAAVERLREGQAALDHRLAEHLGLPGERQSVPGYVAAGDGLLHDLAVGGRGLLEVFEEQPGAGGPHIAALAAGVVRRAQFRWPREIFVKYLWTTLACVSMKPASKWHLNMASTRFTAGSGFGWAPWARRARGERSRRPVPAAETAFTKARRFMGVLLSSCRSMEVYRSAANTPAPVTFNRNLAAYPGGSMKVWTKDGPCGAKLRYIGWNPRNGSGTFWRRTCRQGDYRG